MSQTAYWPCPPDCFTWRPCPLRVRRGSSRGTRSSPGGAATSTPNFALQPLHLHVEVRLAHAVDHGLVRLLVALDAERRVLLAQPREPGRRACPRRPWSSARSRTRAAARAARRAASCTGVVLRATRCRRCGCAASFATAPMSPAATSGDRLMLLAAQREELADPLLGALRGVVHRGVGPHRPGEHAEHRDVARRTGPRRS